MSEDIIVRSMIGLDVGIAIGIAIVAILIWLIKN